MSGFPILYALKPADAAGLAEFHRVAATALAFDGYAPFNEQSLFDLQSGLRTAYLVTVAGTAVSTSEPEIDPVEMSTSDSEDGVAERDDVEGTIVVGAALAGRGEVDLVVIPEFRRQGYGRTAFRELADTEPTSLTAWSHGDHPAARALAIELRFVAARTLLELRMPLVAGGDADPKAGASALGGESISAFQVGRDDAEWVALNALVFATHPEQGAMTEADLTARRAESWFNADDFLILRDADQRMIGYNWLKVDGAIGEIYVIGVHPDAAGRGLGRALMQAGLQRLVAAGCTIAALYVEADSLGPVHLYRDLGFHDHTVDVQYRRLTD